MKTFFGIAAAVLLVVFLSPGAYAGEEKYKDAKQFMDDWAEEMEKFADSVEKAENREDYLKAMEGYSSRLEGLVPRWESLLKKHPRLMSGPPAELYGAADRLDSVGHRYNAALAKAFRFANGSPDDTGLETAAKRLKALIEEMQSAGREDPDAR